MRRLSFVIFFLFFCFVGILTSISVRAQGLTISIVPNPVINNRTTYLIVSGCPAGQAKFTWKKNNSVSKSTDVTNGIAYVTNEFDVGHYDLTVTCGGSSASTSFESQNLNGGAYFLNDDPGHEADCEVTGTYQTLDPNTLFATQASCNAALTQLKAIAGYGWTHDRNAITCTRNTLLPPQKAASNAFPSLDACNKDLNKQDVGQKYDIVDNANTGPLCIKATSGKYASEADCQRAIKASYVYYIYQPDANTQAVCRQIEKSKAGSQKTFTSQQDCQNEINSKWYYLIPKTVGEEQLTFCQQNYAKGQYKTEDECQKAFCAEISQGDYATIYKDALTKYCKEDLGELVDTPTPLPPVPPCAVPLDTETKDSDGSITKVREQCFGVSSSLGMNLLTTPTLFIRDLFTILLSLSGGIALILIIYSGYQLMISRGNPEIVKAARERLTSAIVGLLFLVFSLVILQIIGVDLLHIPGMTS